MTNDDIWKCKYVTAGEDKDGITVPCCTLCGMPCEDVLRYGDEGCVLSMTKEKATKIIEDGLYWYMKNGVTALCDAEVNAARDMAISALEKIGYLKDRPCSVCEFNKENGCCKWTCVFTDRLFGDMR